MSVIIIIIIIIIYLGHQSETSSKSVWQFQRFSFFFKVLSQTRVSNTTYKMIIVLIVLFFGLSVCLSLHVVVWIKIIKMPSKDDRGLNKMLSVDKDFVVNSKHSCFDSHTHLLCFSLLWLAVCRGPCGFYLGHVKNPQCNVRIRC